MAFKRKNYMVKRSFQVRLMLRIFSVIAIIIALLTGSLFIVNELSFKTAKGAIVKHIESLNEINPVDVGPTDILKRTAMVGQNVRIAVDNLRGNMVKAFIASLVLALLLTGTVFLLISHRIAGPVYRIEKSLQALEQGDLTMRVYLRDQDEFKDLGDIFNSMTASLNDKVNRIQQTIIQLQIDVEKENIDAEAKRRLIDRVSSLENLLKQFKITYT
ncbi:MAG: methyl-accepting chemotaxis protein [Spirochaetes bacterium]|nr:methyl-accepting chemotaxis protein [Spirochaetota bacterium]